MAERRKRQNAGDGKRKKRRRMSEENAEEEPQQETEENVETIPEEGQDSRPTSRAESRPTSRTESRPTSRAESRPGSTAPDVSEDLLNMYIPDRPIPAMSTDPDAPRLIISKIVVENFKSYFGKQVLGPFHKNYTSILGPNGSGKSNVIDSLLFVFGFRANKIRSKKIAVLIHNSTAHPSVRSCSVSVHFAKIIDKGTTHEVHPGSEFYISRTATKSGSSTYEINGSKATMSEVQKKLKSNGIDLDHNRFLILQGEVEQISLMKPMQSGHSEEDGMLEYLEDIIGSSRLKKPIEKFKKRIQIYENDETMVQQRLKLASSEVETLRGPVTETIRLMRVQNAITKCQYQMYCIDRLELTERSNQANAEFDKFKGRLTLAENNLNGCNDEIKKLRQEKTKAELEETDFKDKIDDVDKKIQDAEREVHRTNEEIVRIENRKTKKEAEIRKERKNLEKAESAPGDAQEEIKTCNEKKDQFEAEIAELEADLRDLRAEEREANQETRDELDKIMPQITKLNDDENEADNKLALAKDGLKRALESTNAPQVRLQDAEEREHQLHTELLNLQAQLQQITDQIPQLTEDAKNQEEICKTQRIRENELVERANHLQREIAANKFEANTNNANSVALAGLMQEKQSGRIKGIFGRLGDLGGIDERYDVAISTCCPGLENIVVDNVETAELCISYLKDNNLTRITFIVLDKQQVFWANLNNKPNTPEDAPRLVDLIRVTDKDVKPAFYSVLRDTLFANNIEDATRISAQGDKRWRVVTARGDLVESTGTMSGGGRREMRGRMGKKVRVDTSQAVTERDWREMENEVRELRDETNRLRMELSKNIDLLKRQKDDLLRLKNEERKLNQNIPKIQRQYERAQKEVVEARAAVQNTHVDESGVNGLRSEIEKFEREKQAISERGSSLREQKEQLDSKIKEVEDRILGKTRSELDKLRKDSKKIDVIRNKAQLTLKNSSSNIEKIRKAIQNAETAIQTAQDELVNANSTIVNLRNRVENHVQHREDYRKDLEKAINIIRTTKQQLTELSKQETEFRQQIDQENHKIDGIKRKMAKLLEDLENVETEIGKLSLYSIRADIVLPDIAPTDRSARNDANATVVEEAVQQTEEPQEAVSFPTNDDERSQEAENIPVNDEANDEGIGEEEAGTGEVNEESGNVEGNTEENEGSGEGNDDTPEQDAETPVEPSEEDQMLAQEIDEETEALPDTTIMTTAEGDITHNPAYDMGTLQVYTPDEIREFNRDEIKLQKVNHEKRKAKFKIKLNLTLIEEYAEKMERQAEVKDEMDKLKAILGKHRRKCLELTQMRNDEFNDGFQKICLATQEIYQMITLGGDAILEKVNSMDTFKEGITFQVRPPKKTWKQITNLSGGEKTLASLALVFGLHTYRPTPLYVMDEIDAALDYRNVSIISTYLKERTKNAQFIIISLRNNMFENGDRLLGIYKVNDCTHNVVYDTECFADDDSDSDVEN